MKKYDELLDVSGLNCPLPVLKAKEKWASLAQGQVLKVISTDPLSKVDVPVFCHQVQAELLSQEETANHYIFFIKKTK